MRILDTNPTRIVPDEGMVLTNGLAYSTDSKYIELGVNDSPDNWYEITAEEAERLQNEEFEEEVC